MGGGGNPRPLVGHMSTGYERYKEDILHALDQMAVANVTFNYGSTGSPPVFLHWEPELGYKRKKSVKVVVLWSLIFGLCWLPFTFIMAAGD